METVIRSPQKGVIAKLVHQAGDICKAGTALVLFEEVCYPLTQSSKCYAEANFYKTEN
jgi:multidrug resistance efflux pump